MPKEVLMQEQELKEKISSDLENFINSMKDNWVNSFQKQLQEAEWYLGEERSRKHQLENDLTSYQNRCQELETQLRDAWASFEQLKKELSDAQWYLGEERSRRQQLENQLRT